MADKEKPEVLQRIEEFQRRLQALGIPRDKVREIATLLTDYNDLQEDLQEYRRTQFYGDANELVYKLSGRGQNRIGVASAFLRDFAEHIAGYIIGREGTVVDLVDEIPVMTDK